MRPGEVLFHATPTPSARLDSWMMIEKMER